MKNKNGRGAVLTSSALLEEKGTSGIMRSIIWGALIIVVAFVVWSVYMPLDEVAVAKGELGYEMQMQDVQHPTGGVIQAIFVKNGDRVKKDDILVELDGEVTATKMKRAKDVLNSLLARKERLEAYLEHREPRFEKFPEEVKKMIKEQTLILKNLIDSEKTRYELLASQINQANDELAKLNTKKKTLDEQYDLIKKELAIQSKLEKSGAVARLVILRLKRNVSQLEQEAAAIPQDIERVKNKLKELTLNRTKIKTDLIEKFRNELEQVNQKLPQAKADVAKLEYELSHLKLLANVDGTIYNLNVHTKGAVLKPMSTVMQIVPKNQILVAEVKISSRDIGYVRVGMPAKVKLTTFDFSRFGAISGQVKRISASSYRDKRGVPYYVGVVSLDRQFMLIGDEHRELLSGMSVEADIKTGTKSLMQYLLRPIFKSASQALRER
jgi:HlyD family secretion protein/adhesin transport system membrane fusion protein